MAEVDSRSRSPTQYLSQAQSSTEPPSSAHAKDYHKGVTYSPIRQERNLNGSTKDALAGSSTAFEVTGFPFGNSADTYEDGINTTSAEVPRLRGVGRQSLLRKASNDHARGLQEQTSNLASLESSNPQGSPSIQFSRPAVETEQSSKDLAPVTFPVMKMQIGLAGEEHYSIGSRLSPARRVCNPTRGIQAALASVETLSTSGGSRISRKETSPWMLCQLREKVI